MTTDTERCPQCDDNNRCGHEWHGDIWEHQAATVIRGLRTELDAARARERHALVAGAEALRRIAAATPIGHEDVTKGPSTYTWLCYAASLLMAEAAVTPATPLEQELTTLRAREVKLRDVLVRIKADHDGRLDMEDCGCGICEDVRAALTPVCDCNGGEQGDGLCALPHEPTCASLKREDTRG